MSKDDIPEMNFVDMDVDFAKIMEESTAEIKLDFKAGDQIEGVVTMIGENSVFVNINGKSEGIIPKVEFIKDDELKIQEGDKVTAYFVSDEGGELALTMRMSGDALHNSLEEAFANEVPVEGKVVEERKGGFTVNLAGIDAFCPYSQIDRGAGDASAYVGNTYTFVITRMTQFDVVVSRRPILEKEAAERREELVDTLNEGDVIEGRVRKIESFGVFVDLGAIDGLIPMGELSWSRDFDVNSLVKVGDQVTVTVRRLDWERNRIVLSLREAGENPWDELDGFSTGEAYKGKVTRVESYGAFVELKPGLEGLVHISKLGKGKRLAHASEVAKEGDELEVFILEMNSETRRISLSLEDEAHEFEGHEHSGVPTGHSNAVTVGNVITGKIDGIKNFGLFVKLNESKKGLLHISGLDAPKGGDSLKFLNSNYNVGDDIEVEVHHIEGTRISLGLPGSNAEAEDKKAVREYMQESKSKKSFGSLGDMFGGLDL